MRNIIFYKGNFNVIASLANLICVFMIILLTGACATDTKKQTLASVNKPNQASAASESENANLTGDNEIVCRTRIATGSRFKRKICQTKKAWALYDNKNRKKTDQFERDIRSNDVNTGNASDAMGGESMGVPR